MGSRWLGGVAAGVVLSGCLGLWTACGGSSDVSGLDADDGSADSASSPPDGADDASSDDATTEAGDDATLDAADADSAAEAGATQDGEAGAASDAGATDASEAGDAADASADAADAAPPRYCAGSGGGTVSVNVTCPPSSTTPCALTDGGSGDAGDGGSPMGACGSAGGASYSTCTPTQCAGTGSGIGYSVACHDGTSCSFGLGGIDFCAACGAGATCVFTDNGSAGSQAYYCGPGSDCTIHMNGSSGSRLVECSQAAKCTVTGFVSGETEVDCPADCSVNVGGGFGTTCCSTPPIQCHDGSYRCSPAGAGDAGADAAADGGC